jgi:hypothetical protein
MTSRSRRPVIDFQCAKAGWLVKIQRSPPSITMMIIQSRKKFAQMQVVSAFLVRVESAAFDMQELRGRGGPEQIEKVESRVEVIVRSRSFRSIDGEVRRLGSESQRRWKTKSQSSIRRCRDAHHQNLPSCSRVR